jgi:hypothetical protein
MPKAIDLTGKIFGEWKVLGVSSERGADGGILWYCLCSCGAKRNVLSSLLRRGESTSCGRHSRGPLYDLTGIRFGRLTVVSLVPSNRSPYYWHCQCDCGKTLNAEPNLLISGGVKSCGCLRKELLRTHGYSHLWEYGCWWAMVSRCCNPNDSSYKNYGGRGIKVCDRWIDSFEDFFKDMGERPGSEYSIDRKDNNGNYEPGNCRWATRSQQQRNKRPYSEWNFKS